MIYKMLNGTHIDLSKIVSVDPVDEIIRGFRVNVQLMDKTLKYGSVWEDSEFEGLTETTPDVVREDLLKAWYKFKDKA